MADTHSEGIMLQILLELLLPELTQRVSHQSLQSVCCCYSQSSDEETEAQRGQGSSPPS